MKKIVSLIIVFLCFAALPITVYGKNEKVTISSAAITATEATVSGTTDALAVIVQVRDKDDNILGMSTFGTLNKKFTGTIDNLTLAEDTEYTIYVADYEGGAWTKETVKYSTTTAATTTATTTAAAKPAATTTATTAVTTAAATTAQTSPKTGDPVLPYAAIALLALSGLFGIYAVKKQK